jgi:hypothetical protein
LNRIAELTMDFTRNDAMAASVGAVNQTVEEMDPIKSIDLSVSSSAARLSGHRS